MALAGCDIQNAKVNKRQLAIRLVKDSKEQITLDVSAAISDFEFMYLYKCVISLLFAGFKKKLTSVISTLL